MGQGQSHNPRHAARGVRGSSTNVTVIPEVRPPTPEPKPPPRPTEPPQSRPTYVYRPPSYLVPENKVLPTELPVRRLKPLSSQLSQNSPHLEHWIVGTDEDLDLDLDIVATDHASPVSISDSNANIIEQSIADVDKRVIANGYTRVIHSIGPEEAGDRVSNDLGVPNGFDNNSFDQPHKDEVEIMKHGSLRTEEPYVPQQSSPPPINRKTKQFAGLTKRSTPLARNSRLSGEHSRYNSNASDASIETRPLPDEPEAEVIHEKLERLESTQSNTSLPQKSSFDLDFSYNLTYAQLAEHRRQNARAAQLDKLAALEKRSVSVENLASVSNDVSESRGKTRVKVQRQDSRESYASVASSNPGDRHKRKKYRAPPPPTTTASKISAPPPTTAASKISAIVSTPPATGPSSTVTVITVYTPTNKHTEKSAPQRTQTSSVFTTAEIHTPLEALKERPPEEPPVDYNTIPRDYTILTKQLLLQTTKQEPSQDEAACKIDVRNKLSLDQNSSSKAETKSNQEPIIIVKSVSSNQPSKSTSLPAPISDDSNVDASKETVDTLLKKSLSKENTHSREILNTVSITKNSAKEADTISPLETKPKNKEETTLNSPTPSLSSKDSGNASFSAPETPTKTGQKLSSLLQHDIIEVAQAKAAKTKRVTPSRPKQSQNLFSEELAKMHDEREMRMKTNVGMKGDLDCQRKGASTLISSTDYLTKESTKIEMERLSEHDRFRPKNEDNVIGNKMVDEIDDSGIEPAINVMVQTDLKISPRPISGTDVVELERNISFDEEGNVTNYTPRGAGLSRRQHVRQINPKRVSDSRLQASSFSEEWTPAQDLDDFDDDLRHRLTQHPGTPTGIASEGFKTNVIPRKFGSTNVGTREIRPKSPQKQQQLHDNVDSTGSISKLKQNVKKGVKNVFSKSAKSRRPLSLLDASLVASALAKQKRTASVDKVVDESDSGVEIKTTQNPVGKTSSSFSSVVEKSDAKVSNSSEKSKHRSRKERYQARKITLPVPSDASDESEGSRDDDIQMMRRAGVAYIGGNGQIVLLPDGETEAMSEESKLAEEEEHIRALKRDKKGKKFPYNATARRKEKSRVEEIVNKEIEVHEKAIEEERKKQQDMEHVFKSIRGSEIKPRSTTPANFHSKDDINIPSVHKSPSQASRSDSHPVPSSSHQPPAANVLGQHNVATAQAMGPILPNMMPLNQAYAQLLQAGLLQNIAHQSPHMASGGIPAIASAGIPAASVPLDINEYLRLLEISTQQSMLLQGLAGQALDPLTQYRLAQAAAAAPTPGFNNGLAPNMYTAPIGGRITQQQPFVDDVMMNEIMANYRAGVLAASINPTSNKTSNNNNSINYNTNNSNSNNNNNNNNNNNHTNFDQFLTEPNRSNPIYHSSDEDEEFSYFDFGGTSHGQSKGSTARVSVPDYRLSSTDFIN